MTARAAGPRGSLASPSSGLSERRWVNPSLSLAGLCPLQRSSGQVEFCLKMGTFSISSWGNGAGKWRMSPFSGLAPQHLGADGLFPGERREGLALVDALAADDLLPRVGHLRGCAAKVPVSRGGAIHRVHQVEHLDDAVGPQVEMRAHQGLELVLCDAGGAETLHADRGRLRDADRVGNLDLAAVRETGRDDVLRDVAGGVRGGPVDLRWILARKRAA